MVALISSTSNHIASAITTTWRAWNKLSVVYYRPQQTTSRDMHQSQWQYVCIPSYFWTGSHWHKWRPEPTYRFVHNFQLISRRYELINRWPLTMITVVQQTISLNTTLELTNSWPRLPRIRPICPHGQKQLIKRKLCTGLMIHPHRLWRHWRESILIGRQITKFTLSDQLIMVFRNRAKDFSNNYTTNCLTSTSGRRRDQVALPSRSWSYFAYSTISWTASKHFLR